MCVFTHINWAKERAHSSVQAWLLKLLCQATTFSHGKPTLSSPESPSPERKGYLLFVTIDLCTIHAGWQFNIKVKEALTSKVLHT